MNRYVERTLIGFLFGAVVGNIIGFTFRFLFRYWYVIAVLVVVFNIAYKNSDARKEMDIARQAEQTMLGTPSEEAAAEAEERGEVAKAAPKVSIANLMLIPYSVKDSWSGVAGYEAVEVDITNSGSVDVKDVGITCRYRRVGDHPRDEPRRLSATVKRHFIVLKAGETARLRFQYDELRQRKVEPGSVQCEPFWDIVPASANTVAGIDDLTNVVQVSYTPRVFDDRRDRNNYVVATVSGEITNPTTNRFVSSVLIDCMIVKNEGLGHVERDAESAQVKVYLAPGETKSFGPVELTRNWTSFDARPYSATCRTGRVYEENAEARAERLTKEAAQAEKLSKLTALERKRRRESRSTLWGGVSDLWR